MSTKTEIPSIPPAPVSSWEALKYWLKLGFISFGGPAGQISMMHQELVGKRRWISEHRFLHALNYCMLLPVAEAPGVEALLAGLRASETDDDTLLDNASNVFDWLIQNYKEKNGD